ncbi:MAG TPA: glycoside hydrolase family 13 protein [Candidatus Deferrimicrobiaceae bacterium]|nr:glycoside hydrolase family 13 protein [Candidatus Deferrimicrobiaceae bacterium]
MPDTPAWVRDAVFYEIFPDRFAASDRVPKPGPLEAWDAPPTYDGFKGGDLLGVAEHLDHIESLGATAIYLTPIFQSASNHRYHTFDYLAVDPLLGGDEALRELLDRAHGRGIRIVLDGVFNHTGRGFWPFHHVLETGAGSPYRHWFHLDQEALDRGLPIDAYPAAHERLGVAIDQPHPGEVEGPDGDSLARLGYRGWWDMPALPKLNVADPAVREHLWAVAEHWLRFGIDGWRLDVPAEIDDRSFWAEFRDRCRAVNPEAYLVGEIWHVAPDWLSGDRFDGLMNYPLAKAILGFVAGEATDWTLIRRHHEYAQIEELDGAAFGEALGSILGAYASETNAAQLNLLASHDTPRALAMLGGDRVALELAVLLQAVLPGAPCVYYGDEVGVSGGHDPDNRRAFPWDEAHWDRELLAAVRSTIGLRRREAALRSDGLAIAAAAGRAVALLRGAVGNGAGPEAGVLVVALNAGAEATLLQSDGSVGPGRGDGGLDVLHVTGAGASADIVAGLEDGRLRLGLPPRTGLVARLR